MKRAGVATLLASIYRSGATGTDSNKPTQSPFGRHYMVLSIYRMVTSGTPMQIHNAARGASGATMNGPGA